MSLRLAIGAGRGRIIRQLLTESSILALLGAAGGAVVGYAGIQLMGQLTIVSDAAVDLDFALDYRVLSFGLVTAVGSVFLFGLGPALRSSRADLTESLRMGGSQSAKPRQWTRNVLVTGQIALSMVLLTMASLMFQTFRRDLLAGPGFRSDSILMAAFDPSLVGYDETKTHNFYKSLPERVRSLPGVRSVSLASMVPANYNYETMSIAPERYQLPEGLETVAILTARVDENYFTTLQVPLVRGRSFVAADVASSPLVAVVNDTAAQQFWPGQDPIGKRIRLGDGRWLEVVGVAKTGKYRFLMERPTPFMYVSFAQHPRSSMVLLIESTGDPRSLAAPLRSTVRALDANLPVYGVRTLKQTFDANAVDPNLLIIRLEAVMGGMGVLLALSGLYGLMAYSVSTRRREIGIRMAVGADRRDVLGMVLRQGFVLAGAGSVIGLVLAAAAGRLLVAVFPATENSAFVYLIVIPAVFSVTLLAALIPASRAANVDPSTVLRQG
jgi:predicted permease